MANKKQFNPSNTVNGPDYQEIEDWLDKAVYPAGDVMRPAAATWQHDFEDVPQEMFEQMLESCVAQLTCPKCGNSAFYFTIPNFSRAVSCVVDGCDAVLQIQ